jgi:uncharacterized membrane protein
MRISPPLGAVALSLLLVAPSADAYTAEPPPPWAIDGGKRVGEEVVKQREREDAEAAARKAAEERAPVEAQEQRERERAALDVAQQREAEVTEREATEREAQAVACHVPGLRGHSLSSARRLLRASDCSLGRVRIRPGSHGALIVVRQGIAAGAHRPSGTHVTIVLGRRRA